MSAANKAADPAAITLDELEGLIKRLGRLGSAHDGEVLVAARFVVKWLVEHHTDWPTLLTPPEEPLAVSGVAVAGSDATAERDRLIKAAYRDGYTDGSRAMASAMTAQLRAQQTMQAAAQANWTGGIGTPWAGGLGATPGVSNANMQPRQGPAPQAAPAASHGSWQAVAQELLDRHGSGIPGVLRPKEEQFVQDILARGFRTLTQAQEDWLRAIAGRSAMSW